MGQNIQYTKYKSHFISFPSILSSCCILSLRMNLLTVECSSVTPIVGLSAPSLQKLFFSTREVPEYWYMSPSCSTHRKSSQSHPWSRSLSPNSPGAHSPSPPPPSTHVGISPPRSTHIKPGKLIPLSRSTLTPSLFFHLIFVTTTGQVDFQADPFTRPDCYISSPCCLMSAPCCLPTVVSSLTSNQTAIFLHSAVCSLDPSVSTLVCSLTSNGTACLYPN